MPEKLKTCLSTDEIQNSMYWIKTLKASQQREGGKVEALLEQLKDENWQKHLYGSGVFSSFWIDSERQTRQPNSIESLSLASHMTS